MEFDFESKREHFISELNKRVPDLKCPACGADEFSLGGGYFAHDIQKTLNERRLGGVLIPTVPLICRNCGFIMEFAAGTLGLLPKPEEKESQEQVKKHENEE